jgi:hypothetical protein
MSGATACSSSPLDTVVVNSVSGCDGNDPLGRCTLASDAVDSCSRAVRAAASNCLKPSAPAAGPCASSRAACSSSVQVVTLNQL